MTHNPMSSHEMATNEKRGLTEILSKKHDVGEEQLKHWKGSQKKLHLADLEYLSNGTTPGGSYATDPLLNLDRGGPVQVGWLELDGLV